MSWAAGVLLCFFACFIPHRPFGFVALLSSCARFLPRLYSMNISRHKKRIRGNCSALMIPFSSVLFVCVCLCDRYCTRLYLVQWHFSCSASQYAIKVSENVHLFECFLLFLFANPVQACPSIDSDDTFFHAIQSFSALPNLTLSGVFFWGVYSQRHHFVVLMESEQANAAKVQETGFCLFLCLSSTLKPPSSSSSIGGSR